MLVANVYPNSGFGATLGTQVRGILRDLLFSHTAYYGWLIKKYQLSMSFELWVGLAVSFQLAYPQIEVDLEEFIRMFREVHGLHGGRILHTSR